MPIIERKIVETCLTCGKVLSDTTTEISFERYQQLSGDRKTPKPCQDHNDKFKPEIKKNDKRGSVQLNKQKRKPIN